MSNRSLSGSLEESVLIALIALGGRDYAVPIKHHIDAVFGKKLVLGALYATLLRLESKGFVESEEGEGRPERANLPRKYYRITAKGRDAVAEADRLRSQLRLSVSAEMTR